MNDLVFCLQILDLLESFFLFAGKSFDENLGLVLIASQSLEEGIILRLQVLVLNLQSLNLNH